LWTEKVEEEKEEKKIGLVEVFLHLIYEKNGSFTSTRNIG
jgi:hypothetical protein